MEVFFPILSLYQRRRRKMGMISKNSCNWEKFFFLPAQNWVQIFCQNTPHQIHLMYENIWKDYHHKTLSQVAWDSFPKRSNSGVYKPYFLRFTVTSLKFIAKVLRAKMKDFNRIHEFFSTLNATSSLDHKHDLVSSPYFSSTAMSRNICTQFVVDWWKILWWPS